MTSPVDTSVKYFHSGMVGAPVLSGTAGALIAVLDACLKDGFGLKTVDSLTVAGNVATMSISTGHSAEVGAVQLVAGATPSALNGEQRVTAVTATTIQFATTGISDQTATGTITTKVAPANWTKQHSGTNLAAYKSSDVTASGCVLRVDDAGAKTARVVGYETMSDVNTGSGPFPTSAQRSGGAWWNKSNAADSTPRTWILVADGKMFYFARAYFLSAPAGNTINAFGDYLSTKSGDVFGCVLSANATDVSSSSPAALDNYWASDSNSGVEFYSPRSYTGVGSSVQLRRSMSNLVGASVTWVSGAAVVPYPNGPDGGLYTVPHHLLEDAALVLRGTSPGFYGVPQNVPNGAFAAKDGVTGVSTLPGRLLKAITCTVNSGVCFIDITGPWR